MNQNKVWFADTNNSDEASDVVAIEFKDEDMLVFRNGTMADICVLIAKRFNQNVHGSFEERGLE